MTSSNSIAGRAILTGIVGCLLLPPGKAVSQDTGSVGTSAAAVTPDSRLACPPEAIVDEAIELIRAAYEAAYDKAKDTGEPEPLIEQLVSIAGQTTDHAKKYALLLEAESVATQYENYATAVDLLGKRAEQFQIDELKLKGQLLKRLAGPKVAADLVLLDQASETAEQAMQAERFDVAAEAASLAVGVAKAIDRAQKAEAKKRARSSGKTGAGESGPTPVGPGLVKKATALQSRAVATQKAFTEYSKALTTVQSQPDDQAANSAVAKYLCFFRGEWGKGLPSLAKSDLESLSVVAAEEIALSSATERDGRRIFELAGKWWAASESKKLTEDQQSAVKDHAASLYADVVNDLSDAIEKQLAKSRLRGLAAGGDESRNPAPLTLPLPPQDLVLNSIGIKLKLLPSGTFMMGSNDGDPDEKPVHEVRITKPFYLSLTEVTNAQWKAVMLDVPSRWKDDDRPVEQVTWDEVVVFCEKLSAMPAERAAGREYRLPTEAEWEYACRAGTTTHFSYGDNFNALNNFGWIRVTAEGETHPVALKTPNPWGFYDMHGNVWELVKDCYGPYENGPVTDPQGPNAPGRVIRGASWHDLRGTCRTAKRGQHAPNHRQNNVGFRLAMSPPRTPIQTTENIGERARSQK